jgi:hypothetical protein
LGTTRCLISPFEITPTRYYYSLRCMYGKKS